MYNFVENYLRSYENKCLVINYIFLKKCFFNINYDCLCFDLNSVFRAKMIMPVIRQYIL